MPDLSSDVQLEAHQRANLVQGRPADEALLTLLAHMAVSDGVVHAEELGFLARVRPGVPSDELASWARQRAQGPLDLDGITAAMDEPDDQWRCLRFTARMAWKDGDMAEQERAFLERLAAAFRLPDGAVDRVINEMSPHDDERFSAKRLLEVLAALRWDAVQLASGALVSSDLAAVIPDQVEIIARVGLERVEVMGLSTHGMVARFQEGPAFLWWSDLVAWARTRELGAAVTLHTEDGAVYTLVDSRLGGLAGVLDRLLDDRERPKGEEPKVELRRGED